MNDDRIDEALRSYYGSESLDAATVDAMLPPHRRGERWWMFLLLAAVSILVLWSAVVQETVLAPGVGAATAPREVSLNELIPDGRHALTVTMDAALIDGVALEPEVDIWYADGGRLIPMDEPCRVLATSPEAFTFAIEPEGVPLITDAVSFDLPVIPAAVGDEAHLLEQVMMWHRRQVLGCYDEALSRGGEVDGELVVGWRLDMGVVQEAHVLRDTLERPALTDCVLDHAVDWRFPVTMDGDVHWPFAFRAGHAEERDRGTHRP